MLLKAILVPISAILAVVSALPTAANTALEAEAELEVRAAPGGYEDEGEVIDITSWVASNVPGVSPRSDDVFARDLEKYGIKCGTGKPGEITKFYEWFNAAGDNQVCQANNAVTTWVDGKNRFKAANRTGSRRCNKFSTFGTNAFQLKNSVAIQCRGKSRWGRDHVFPQQTFSLYSV